MAKDFGCVLAGVVLGVALLVISAATVTQLADTNLFHEKDTP